MFPPFGSSSTIYQESPPSVFARHSDHLIFPEPRKRNLEGDKGIEYKLLFFVKFTAGGKDKKSDDGKC